MDKYFGTAPSPKPRALSLAIQHGSRPLVLLAFKTISLFNKCSQIVSWPCRAWHISTAARRRKYLRCMWTLCFHRPFLVIWVQTISSVLYVPLVVLDGHQGYKDDSDVVPCPQDSQCGRKTGVTQDTWSTSLSSIGRNDTGKRSGQLFRFGGPWDRRTGKRRKEDSQKRITWVKARISFVQTL